MAKKKEEQTRQWGESGLTVQGSVADLKAYANGVERSRVQLSIVSVIDHTTLQGLMFFFTKAFVYLQ